MRQLVSALEYRFQSLEEADSVIPSTTVDGNPDDLYAPLNHTHVVADITDFFDNVPTSIFDLDDVDGSPSIGETLIWDGNDFVPGTSGGSHTLGSHSDVYVPAPNDGEALTYVSSTGRWESLPQAGAGANTLLDLDDTDIATQNQFDLLFNADGTEWQHTATALRWNPAGQYLELANNHSINWRDPDENSVELLNFEFIAGPNADPNIGDVVLLLTGETAAAGATSITSDIGNHTFTSTGAGTAEVSTNQAYFGTRSLRTYYPSGANFGIWTQTGTSADFDFAGGDFTIEFDFYSEVQSGTQYPLVRGGITGGSNLSWYVTVGVGANINRIDFAYSTNGTGYTLAGTATPGFTVGAWYRVAICRNGADLRYYVDGTQVGTTKNVGTSVFFGGSGSLEMINNSGISIWYMDNVRITKGVARYTGASYTLGTEPYDGSFGTTSGSTDFIVGDPAYPTEIDGTQIGTKFDVGINWDNSTDGTDVELAIFSQGDPTGPTNDWGTDPSSDWTYFGIVAGDPDTTALYTTGILSGNGGATSISVWDVSNDGLHCIQANTTTDRVYSYDLDTPYSFENATQTVSPNLSFINPYQVLQFMDNGNKMLVGSLDTDNFYTYFLTTPYQVPDGMAADSFVTDVDLGYDNNSTDTNGNMTENGLWFISAGEKGNVLYLRLHQCNTAYKLDDMTYQNELNLAAVDASWVNSSQINSLYMTDDGASVMMFATINSDEAHLLTMSTPFDISTATFTGTALNVDTAAFNTIWKRMHISGDGTSLYFHKDSGGTQIIRFDRTTTPAPGPGGDTFILGDPSYPTWIDGSIIELNGPTLVDNTLNVTGAVDLDGTLNVDGVADFNAVINANADIEANANVDINGGTLTIFDSLGTSSVSSSHNSTDFNTAFTGTVDWNLTGLEALAFDLDASVDWLDSVGTQVELLTFTAEGTTSIGGDPYWEEVSLLADFDGADAATSYTSIDDAARVATFNNNAQLDDAQKKFGTTSLLLDGTNDYITFPDADELSLGANDFTIECWFRTTTLASDQVLIAKWIAGTNQREWALGLFPFSATGLTLYYSTSGSSVSSINASPDWDPVINTWYHVAAVREGDVVRFYIDGEYLSESAFAVTLFAGSAALEIGSSDVGTNNEFFGHIDDVRVTKGIARYTGGFPVPTSPLTNNPAADLLCNFDGADAATSYTSEDDAARVATFVGNAQLDTAQKKFGTASLLLDGAGDYINFPSSPDFDFSTADLTVEFWMRPADTTVGNIFSWGSGTQGAIYFDGVGTNLHFQTGNTDRINGGTISASTWYHVALVRFGTVFTLYLDGVSLGTYDASVTFDQATIEIGRRVGSANTYNGHIEDVRVINGTAIYTADFTPPTEAYPVYRGVIFLANFDDADGVTTYNSEDVRARSATFSGTAQLDDAQAKFGPTSLVLDGDSDYVTFPDSTDFEFGSGDFTVECWVRFAADPSTNMVFVSKLSAAPNREWAFGRWGTNRLTLYYSTTGTDALFIDTAWDPAANTWYHVAVSRSGNLAYFFVDGVLLNTGGTSLTATFASGTSPLQIGADDDSGYLNFFDGWIDDVRITNGVAVYTADFTPPTEPHSLGATAAADEVFIGGDPAYATRIDGLATNITSASTDIDGTLNVDGAVALQDTLDVAGAATFQSTLDMFGDTLTATPPTTESCYAQMRFYDADGSDLLGEIGFGRFGFGPSHDININNHYNSGRILLRADNAFNLQVTLLVASSISGVTLYHPDGGISFKTTAAGAQVVGELTVDEKIIGDTLDVNGAVTIYDATGADSAAFSHDGTDFNTAFTNTTDWNVTGLTGTTVLGGDGLSITGSGQLTTTPNGATVPSVLDIPSRTLGAFEQQFAVGIGSASASTARVFSVFDQRGGGTAHQPSIGVFSPDETDLFGFSWEGANTTAYLKSIAANLAFRVGSTTYMSIDTGATSVNVVNASFRVYDSGSTDYADFSHDGTDFNTAFTNTTDWNITSLTSIQAGTVDADFDAITATSYGGIAEADLVDKTADETFDGVCTFADDVVSQTYLQLRTATDTELNDITDAVNTDPGKVQGAVAYNTTTDNPVYATGDTDGAVWVDGAGTTVNTPV